MKKNIISINILILINLVILIIGCAFESKTLVTIDGDKYTVADFHANYKFHPTEDSLQRVRKVDEFIYQMLVIKEAKALGYDQDPVVKAAYETHQKDIISRGYYEANVINKAKVSDSELREMYEKMIEQYHLAQIVVAEESLANFIQQELIKGTAFESLLQYSLDTITESGDIGNFNVMSLPPEILVQLENIEIGGTTEAIKFGEFYYVLKLLDHSKAESPTFAEVRDKLESSIKRDKIIAKGEKFVEELFEDANIEYSEEGLDALLKPDSLITEADLNKWVVKKYDTSYVFVRAIRDAVINQYQQSFLEPRILIERVLVPDLIYDKALSVYFDKSIEIKRKLSNTLGLLIYQKFYSDKVLEKITVDSTEVEDYYKAHKTDYPEQTLDQAFFGIRTILRDKKIGTLRQQIFEQLQEKYEVVVNQPVVNELLEEEK